MQFQEVPIADITVSNSRRKTTPERVKAMAESIQEIGLQNPVGLTESKRLIHGRHRLEACQELGWTTIPATIQKLDDIRAEIAEIDENIQRSNYTALEEAKATAKRKELYEALHPETKQGAKGGPGNAKTKKNETDKMAVSFADDTAAKTGRSARTVRRDVEIGQAVSDAAAVQLHGTPVADNKKQLKELAELPPKQQEAVAKAIGSGKAKSVSEAKKLAGVEEPKKREATPADEAKAQIKVWADTIGRWLGSSPSIDEYRKQFPGPRGDVVVKRATELFEALKGWQKEIK